MRQLPAVGTLLESPAGQKLAEQFGAGAVKFAVRRLIDGLREGVRAGAVRRIPAPEMLLTQAAAILVRFERPEARRVINATGVMLHTNLGRAPLCDEAAAAMHGARHYTPVEADVATGKRSLRGLMAEALLREITGCEAAHVVNNNAAATLIILNTVAAGKEVVISRGQLVEIGGSYRMPDVMASSGCLLREVGATNRTHLRDYENAIGPDTGALIHVHTSNYRIRGFSGMPGIGDIAPLGKEHNLPVIDDLGSGALAPLSDFGTFSEPLVADSVASGADLICFSGDKLIGGPQCGIIIGSREWIERIRRNPFARMFRVDKLTLAALEATLLHFINGTYTKAIPFWRMLATPLAELQQRAETLIAAVGPLPGLGLDVVEDTSRIGSGSIPDEGVPTRVVRITINGAKYDVEELGRRLRLHVPHVFTRVSDNAVLLDMRTLLPGDAEALPAILHAVSG